MAYSGKNNGFYFLKDFIKLPDAFHLFAFPSLYVVGEDTDDNAPVSLPTGENFGLVPFSVMEEPGFPLFTALVGVFTDHGENVMNMTKAI